jgi:hypothetical protein
MAEERIHGQTDLANVHHAQFGDRAIPAGCSYLAEVIRRGCDLSRGFCDCRFLGL